MKKWDKQPTKVQLQERVIRRKHSKGIFAKPPKVTTCHLCNRSFTRQDLRDGSNSKTMMLNGKEYQVHLECPGDIK